MRLLPRVLVRLHTVEPPQHTLLAVSVRIWRKEGGNAAEGTTACFPLSFSSPTWGEGGLFHTVREAARIKKPQPKTVGVGIDTLPPLSLERTSQRYVGQVSWLAAFPYSLHLPKVKHPSGFLQISFRSQLRGSDGFAPSSLVTASDCDQPYQRRIQFYVRAYGSPCSVVKDIFAAIAAAVSLARSRIRGGTPSGCASA